jgi:hypothetical protein
MKRISSVIAVMALMAAMVVASAVPALAQGGDVCVSNKGAEKVQKGDSTCS